MAEEKGNTEALSKMIESAKARAGDGYAHGYNGAKPKGSPVSCSEFIDSIRKDAGLPLWLNPGGTQTAYSKIAQQNTTGAGIGGGGAYQEGKSYPAGTIFVARSGVVGDGTHISMSIGNGQVAESVNLGGDRPGPRIKTGVMDGFYGASPGEVLVGYMGDVGTTENPTFGDAANVPGSGMMSGLFEQIASGIAKGLIRFIRALYCISILWPLDWLGGFWWEMTLRLTGGIAKYTEGIDFLALLKGESGGTVGKVEDERLSGEDESEAMWNRFFWLFFIVTTYILAFGTDRKGRTHFDNIWDRGADSRFGPHGAKGYDETATLEAQGSREMTVSSRTGDDLAPDAQRAISDANGEQVVDGDFTPERTPRNPNERAVSKDESGTVAGRYTGRTREVRTRR